MFSKILEIIMDQTGLSEEEITMSATFKQDLGMDSLDMFEIIMRLEDTFSKINWKRSSKFCPV